MRSLTLAVLATPLVLGIRPALAQTPPRTAAPPTAQEIV